MSLIGLSGVAGSGKDLFCEYLIKELSLYNVIGKRYALADKLKEETNQWLKSQYGIDIFTCDRDKKNLVRPFLVFHGRMRRIESKGTHWTSYLRGQILGEKPPVAIVTDIRYDEYEKDEVTWIKEMGGALIHITAYREEANPRFGITKAFVSPPNVDEEKNDPRVKALADLRIEWKIVDNESPYERLSRLRPHIQEVINYLKLV
jgi:hypothetical protein